MNFGAILRELLEENNLTQKQLAEDLNIAATTVGNYIRGIREPDFEILKLFAAYFNVPTDYLLDFHLDAAKSHKQDEIVRLYNSLSDENKTLLTEQAKLLIKLQMKNEQKNSLP